MSTPPDSIEELARKAVQTMFNERGPGYLFSFDEIWSHLPRGAHVPSVDRSQQWRHLTREGWLERTKIPINARSEQRAGNSTRAYRFGPRFSSSTLGGIGTTGDLLKRLQLTMESEGYIISVADLANFYLAMTASPLVILSGISGTGKSLLPRKFAHHTKSGFKSISVQPQWSDNSDLFGYVPTLSPDKFIKGHLIDSVVEAKTNPSKLMIALLDEMNLAPVEHYFSDFLSVVETRGRQGRNIVTDTLPIELPQIELGKVDQYTELRGLTLPHNLRVLGTANMDETTHSFSPKLLDRAFIIEFEDPDLTAFATATAGAAGDLSKLAELIVNPSNAISLQEARPLNEAMFDEVAQLLQEVQEILAPAGIKFGYRPRDAILLYLHFWRQLGLEGVISANAAFDCCLLQKILPRVSGSGESLVNAIKDLKIWLETDRSSSPGGSIATTFTGPFIRSQEKIERMERLLLSDSATHFWGT